MKLLVTGKNGFIAKNVINYFSNHHEVMSISHKDTDEILNHYCKECDFIFHLAAVQRSNNEEDFWKGNVEYTKKIVMILELLNKQIPILFSTSTAIEKSSIFSQTKLEAEKIIREYGKRNNVNVYIFKLNHIFGKYGKPNFNNVVSTFMYNVNIGQPITVNNPSKKLNFTYIDDLIKDFESCFESTTNNNQYILCSEQYEKTLGEIVYIIGKIINNEIDLNNSFEYKMLSTFNYFYNVFNENNI